MIILHEITRYTYLFKASLHYLFCKLSFMQLQQKIRECTLQAVEVLYNTKADADQLNVQITPKEFSGDLTIVIFPLVKITKKKPEIVGKEIGDFLLDQMNEVAEFNVIKGYLNLTFKDDWWREFIDTHSSKEDYGLQGKNGKTIIVEYCSPNTNKPLHLGHLRNLFLGDSLAQILKASGYEVISTCLYNDRGVHISKSMLAWDRWGDGETPESSGIKGDHLIGKYYVLFDKEYKKQIQEHIKNGGTEEDALANVDLAKEIRQLTVKWEEKDPETRALWEKVNNWVYTGFNATYERIGIKFDVNYFESQTYLSGKDIVQEGLEKSCFFKKDDNSVWVDLTGEGLDEKILLRSDGTSVYITQDMGTAQARYEKYKMDRSIYVVADEQDYHFRVLIGTLKKLQRQWADNLYHLSYGMVDLPSGKMKSREGTVVDADELIDEMVSTSEKHTKELGKIEDFSTQEAQELYNIIGLGALKYFLLKVDPKKRMLFNPEASIDFHGHTGPFIQYTYARIQSITSKINGYAHRRFWSRCGTAPTTRESGCCLSP